MRSRGRVVDKEGVLVSFLMVLMKYLSKDSLMVEGFIWHRNPMAQSIMWGKQWKEPEAPDHTDLPWATLRCFLAPPSTLRQAGCRMRQANVCAQLPPFSSLWPSSMKSPSHIKGGLSHLRLPRQSLTAMPQDFFPWVIFRSSQIDNQWASLRASYSKALSLSHSPQPLSSSH